MEDSLPQKIPDPWRTFLSNLWYLEYPQTSRISNIGRLQYRLTWGLIKKQGRRASRNTCLTAFFSQTCMAFEWALLQSYMHAKAGWVGLELNLARIAHL